MKIPLFFHDRIDASVTSFAVAHHCWYYFYEEVLFMVAQTEKEEIAYLDPIREETPIILPNVTGVTKELIHKAVANIDNEGTFKQTAMSYSDLQRHGLEIIGESISKIVLDKLTT